MRIQPVSLYTQTNYSISNNKKVSSYQTSADKVSFGNSLYKSTLKAAVNTTFLKDTDVEKTFNKLFNIIKEDNHFQKLEHFDFLSDLHKKEGLRGMMRELWTENPKPEVRSFLNKISDDFVPLAKQDGVTVLEIFNMGPQGFWNFMRENKNAKRNVELIFSSPNFKDGSFFSLRLNKQGGYVLSQKDDLSSIVTDFYTTTGKRASSVDSSVGGRPDVTYYNEDGSEAFFKNWFFGGTPPIW